MSELTDMMFQSFDNQFAPQLQIFLRDQYMHDTNKEALRSFFLSMLINIFQSHVFERNNLKTGYLASTPNFVYFLTANNGETPEFDFFTFDLTFEDQTRPVLSQRAKENLVAMLLADKLFKFLPEKKLPKAKVVKIDKGSESYQVLY